MFEENISGRRHYFKGGKKSHLLKLIGKVFCFFSVFVFFNHRTLSVATQHRAGPYCAINQIGFGRTSVRVYNDGKSHCAGAFAATVVRNIQHKRIYNHRFARPRHQPSNEEIKLFTVIWSVICTIFCLKDTMQILQGTHVSGLLFSSSYELKTLF